LNTEVSVEQLKSQGFDVILVGIGGTPITPNLPGMQQPNVIQAIDLFRNPALAAQAKNVVVIGGGAVGCEAAQMLAAEYGKHVTVVEMLPYLLKGVCTANRGHLIHELERLGVAMLNCTRLKAVDGNSVQVVRNVSKTVPNPLVTWTPLLPANINNPMAKPIKEEPQEKTLAADLVVLAMGLRADRSFYQACVDGLAASQVRQLGDAFQTGRVFEAVKAGFQVGRSL
jgi:2-enoate reductase